MFHFPLSLRSSAPPLLQLSVSEVEVSKLYETFMKVSDNGETPLDMPAFQRGLGMLVDAGLNNLDDSPFAERCHFPRYPSAAVPRVIIIID